MKLTEELKIFIATQKWTFAKTYADTPFWLNINQLEADEKWSVSNSFRVKCEKIAQLLNIKFAERKGEVFLSLKPKVNETEDVVINNLTAQIELIINKISYN